MKHIKIAAGLAHVNYGNIAGAVKAAADAGADYIHSDAADMYDLKNMQLMGGHQIIEGIRPVTDKPIECHFYTRECDRLFIEKIAAAGCGRRPAVEQHGSGGGMQPGRGNPVLRDLQGARRHRGRRAQVPQVFG